MFEEEVIERPQLSRAELKAKNRFRNRHLWRYTRRAKSSLIPGLILEALTVGTDLAAPYIVGLIMNQQLVEGVGPRDPGFYVGLLALYLLLTLASVACRYFGNLFLNRTANHIARLMQSDVFAHLQRLPIAYFDRLPAGKIVSRVTNDTKAVRGLFSAIMIRLLTAFVYAAGIYINLLFLDINLFLIALIPIPFVILTMWNFRHKSALYSREYRSALSELNSQVNESIQGIEVVKSLGREERVLGEFETVNNRHCRIGIKLNKLWAFSAGNITMVLQYIVLAAALAYFGFGHLTARWFVPLGSLYIFVDYMIKLGAQANNATTRVGDMERAKSAADHIFELLREKPVEESDLGLEPIRGEVSFENISFAYNEEPVLREVSFAIPAGETAAFVGPTGSGKSTIMNLLFGFYRPQEGRICIDDIPFEDLSIQSLRRQMAIVLQDPYLFTGTLYGNIALDRPEITPEMAEHALREVGGGNLLDRLEAGIMSPVTEKGAAFSAGERQLISFARALAQDPKILVLDEATSSVDSETEKLIQHGISRLERGRTTLLIAHRLSTIRHAQQIFVLKDGRIVERGDHDALVAADGIYREMIEEQSRGAAGLRQ